MSCPPTALLRILKSRLPGARSLMLGIAGDLRPSRRTRTTMLEHQHMGGIINATAASCASRLPGVRADRFRRRPRAHHVTIPWATRHCILHDGNSEHRSLRAGARADAHRAAAGPPRWLAHEAARCKISSAPTGTRGRARVRRAEREQGRSFVWGRVEDEQGAPPKRA